MHAARLWCCGEAAWLRRARQRGGGGTAPPLRDGRARTQLCIEFIKDERVAGAGQLAKVDLGMGARERNMYYAHRRRFLATLPVRSGAWTGDRP